MQNNLKKIIITFLIVLLSIAIYADDYEGFFGDTLRQLFRNVPKTAMIGIIYISENDVNTANNIHDDLMHTITELGYCVISKDWLEYLPYFEENYGKRFQFNVTINEESVLEIGKFIRADIALTGRVIEGDFTRRLNLRAIDIKTEQVVGNITCDL